MAFVDSNGARIFWHEIGQGDPIVLIMGLGCSSALWFRFAPRLARHFRVIMLDNRGVGQTVAPRGTMVHRVPDMAGDVIRVMDAAGVEKAHMLGFSMGGMIAQQCAIDHVARLRSLCLLATNCGNPYAILPEWDVRRLLFHRGREKPEQSLRAMRPYVYARTTSADRIAEDDAVRIASYPMRSGYDAQLYGLIYWTSYLELPRLRVPTLVMHGNDDLLIPPQNGKLIASRIPGAHLIEVSDASHFAHTDQPDTVAKSVIGFCRDAGTGRQGV
jgi:3-oxoadipate enol-lactonase